ncbi:MAG: bifunctional hydroxymethylpyrimidine kinase/phosphomethylpyrimidine kinase [Chromatiaceae bacterium]|nr:MAG: bifunctional hydroxymethylpyrimidine kinase/phosphomethylpyrimidine kinase [Chromatiaceae bacterium]
MIPTVLSIAGSDPSGGAGIQADIKAISANGAYAMAVITALTAQNTRGVTAVELVAPAFVRAQLQALFADVRIDAVKIGMLGSADIVLTLAELLAQWRAGGATAPIVLDPVMVAKGGDRLLTAAATTALREQLLPLAEVLTPNLPEAAALLERPEPELTAGADGRAAMLELAAGLQALGARQVLLKGGHLGAGDSPDYLALAGGGEWLEGPRHATGNTHGTGCTLSSALAARLARGEELPTAARQAKAYVAGAIAGADALGIGSGHGPTHHFFALWASMRPGLDTVGYGESKKMSR